MFYVTEESVMELARQLSQQRASNSNSSTSTPSDTKYPSGVMSPAEQPYVPNKEEIMSGLEQSFGELHTGSVSYTPEIVAKTPPLNLNPPCKTSWQQIASKTAPQTFINMMDPPVSDPQDHVVNCDQDNEKTRYSGSDNDLTPNKKKFFRDRSKDNSDMSLTPDSSNRVHSESSNKCSSDSDRNKKTSSTVDIRAGSASVQNGCDYVNSGAMESGGMFLGSQTTRLDGLLNTLAASTDKELLATLIEMVSKKNYHTF